MPRRYPQRFAARRSSQLDRAKVAQFAATFGVSDATIYNWLKQEKVDVVRSRVFAFA